MMGIVQSYRNDDVAGTYIGPLAKRLLYPELFQFYFTTFLCFLFPFASFFIFFLVCNTGSTVLKLYLSTKAPSVTEIIT